jgi:hypothetical protein
MFDIAIAVAARSEPSADIVKDEKLSDELSLIVLKGVFSSGDSSYSFELESGGTGAIIYSDCFSDAEEFDHEVDVETLRQEIEEAVGEEIALQSKQIALDDSEIQSIREEITAERLEEVFWEEINQRLEDPFFSSFYDGEEWGEEFQTERGTVGEFVEFLELCVLTEREVILGNEDYLVVEAETECDSAGISDCSYYSERLGELVEIACVHFKPSGFRYDYNDGCHDRYSGYLMSSESVSISLRESANVPVREKMLGMIRLKEKLSAMEVVIEAIEKLTAF